MAHHKPSAWLGFLVNRGIAKGSIGLGPGCIRHSRGLNATRAKNVKHGLAREDQIISDDPPMASPPYRFRAHDRARGDVTQFAQSGEGAAEVIAHGVIRVIVKALILPECIDVARHIILSAQTAKRRDMFISDSEV
jgi:hypothetical protein